MMITETTAAAVSVASSSQPSGGGKIKRSSFKSRGAVAHGGGGSFKSYRAVRVTVPSTVVAELASKFNAVVVDADRGASARDIIKKVNKTLAKGPAVRATVEKFESATENKHVGGGQHVVVVRTNSDKPQQRTTVGASTAAAAAAEPLPRQTAAAAQSSSIVKRRMEQFQSGKRPPKPKVLAPKPDPDRLRKSQHAFTATVDGPHFLKNKYKRLSIARDPDARLESVLNEIPLLSSPRPPTPDEQRPPEVQPKPNSSFLHGRKRTTTADEEELLLRTSPERCCGADAAATAVDGAGRPGSFLHAYREKKQLLAVADAAEDGRYNYVAAASGGAGAAERCAQAIYEELCDIQISTAAANPSPLPDVVPECSYYDGAGDDHHYTTIECADDEQNIYDDVVTAAAADRQNQKRAADEDGSYETVQAPPPSSSPIGPRIVPSPLPPAQRSDAGGDGDGRLEKKLSDSSLEVDNSIYGLNPPSESTSSGLTSDSAGQNSKFDLDDEWVDVDNTSDELQEIIVFRQKPKIIETTTNGWSSQVRKQLNKAYVSISSQSVISFVKDVPEQRELLNSGGVNGPRDYLDGLQLLSVALKTVFLEEKFESQELSLFFDDEIKEKTNPVSHQEIPEEIYADYDSFDSDDSWDDLRDGEKPKRVPYPCENRDLPALPSQQNIYGLFPLVKRAGNRMKKRWSLGSLGLSRIRKLSVGNLTTDFGNKTYDSTSDKSMDKKFSQFPKSADGLSASIFYLDDPIYNNIGNGQVHAPARNASRPPSSIDSRRLSVARPSSPPPPPPVKRHSTGNNTNNSLPRSICNSKGRPGSMFEKGTTETMSENGSNQGSDLYMRFADEPLYQFYAALISEQSKSVFAGDIMEECDGYEEISSISSRPSALELITPCPSGHGQHRSLWCEVPEVKNSGIIDTLNARERKLQEAKFELITSEASYFKSLSVLEKHFVNSHSMNDETILSKNDRKILFGNVNPVRKCSEKLLASLEKCWQDNILLKGLCEILYTHSKENFDIFVKYCSNQIYIDRTLKSLRDKNFKFNEALQRLESDPKCQSLSLHSFLMLPMQRITRLPLLVDAILTQMGSLENSIDYQMCELTLASLNSIVQNCNESTRKLERYEEMLLLSQQLEFSNKREMKAMSVASSSRWLVRSGSMLHLTSPDAKLTFSRKLIRPTKLYFFLFNDMFFIAKRKSDENYTVVDYCARNFVQMVDATELVIASSYKNLLMLTILENHESKTIEMLLSCDSESSKKRWIEAMSPPISSNPDETLYNEWDCPQVFTEHNYMAIQPDELSLQKGDIVKVLTKMNDGWYHGERIRDGEKGWFPGNYTSEIASQHARAKNLKQRYRLLAMSGSYLQSQQDKVKKK